MRTDEEKIRLAREDIQKDIMLQLLHARRVKIYSLAMPTVVLKDNGTVETVWLDETTDSNLSKINELIEHRTQQILDYYQIPKEQNDE